jgi:ATP-dependent Clp protease ATP-binding subunit ClpC
MFERYTEKARRIIFFARYEASQTGSHIIEPEHLLLGLLREAKALFESGKIQRMIDELRQVAHVEGAAVSTSVDLPLSHSAKQVLVYGADEAEQLHHAHISPEHLLLALMREPGVTATTLDKYGIHRDRIIERMQRDITSETRSRHLVRELGEAFAPLVERLTPEIEPAVLYALWPEVAS